MSHFYDKAGWGLGVGQTVRYWKDGELNIN